METKDLLQKFEEVEIQLDEMEDESGVNKINEGYWDKYEDDDELGLYIMNDRFMYDKYLAPATEKVFMGQEDEVDWMRIAIEGARRYRKEIGQSLGLDGAGYKKTGEYLKDLCTDRANDKKRAEEKHESTVKFSKEKYEALKAKRNTKKALKEDRYTSSQDVEDGLADEDEYLDSFEYILSQKINGNLSDYRKSLQDLQDEGDLRAYVSYCQEVNANPEIEKYLDNKDAEPSEDEDYEYIYSSLVNGNITQYKNQLKRLQRKGQLGKYNSYCKEMGVDGEVGRFLETLSETVKKAEEKVIVYNTDGTIKEEKEFSQPEDYPKNVRWAYTQASRFANKVKAECPDCKVVMSHLQDDGTYKEYAIMENKPTTLSTLLKQYEELESKEHKCSCGCVDNCKCKDKKEQPLKESESQECVVNVLCDGERVDGFKFDVSKDANLDTLTAEFYADVRTDNWRRVGKNINESLNEDKYSDVEALIEEVFGKVGTEPGDFRLYSDIATAFVTKNKQGGGITGAIVRGKNLKELTLKLEAIKDYIAYQKHPEYFQEAKETTKKVVVENTTKPIRKSKSLKEEYCTKKDITKFLKDNKAKEVSLGQFKKGKQLKELIAHGSKKVNGTYDEYKLLVMENGARYIEELAKNNGKKTEKFYNFENTITESTETKKTKRTKKIVEEVVAKFDEGKHEIVKCDKGYFNRYNIKDGKAGFTTQCVEALPTALGALKKRFPNAEEVKE